jgi:RND family efflux transporter MFP subunit
MKLKIVSVVALVAVGVGAAVYALGGAASGSASTTQYRTSQVRTGDVTDDVAASGSLAAADRYGLVFGADPYIVTADSTAPAGAATWTVRTVRTRVGDTVRQGQVLATADTAALKRDLTAAQNAYLSAKVGYETAKTAYSDAQTAGVTAQIRQAKMGLYNAQNQLADARQKVADLKAQIKAATITAPVAGVVTEVHVTVGFDAPSGPAVVVDAHGFDVTTDVTESDLTKIRLDQAASITVAALGSDITGTVTAISPVANAADSSGVVTYPVTVTVKDPPATLRSGMTADVTITVASATGVLTVPAEALNGSAGGYSVLVLGADGAATRTPVEVGLLTNTTAEITSGLTEGQVVVTGTSSQRTGTTTTGGNQRFTDGIAVPGGGGFQGPGTGPVFRQGN